MQHPVAAALRIATTTTATPAPENKCRIECQNIICSPKPTQRRSGNCVVGGGYAIPAGTVYCVRCVCQPKCMSMKLSGVRYANMQQKCILYYVKGNLSELGLALLCQICQMLWQCLLQGACPHIHWQTATVQCVCPCRFRYSVSLFTYHKFFVGEYVFKWAKTGTNSREQSTFFLMKSMMIFQK